MDDQYEIKKGETADDYLYRIGTLKKNNEIDITWPQFAKQVNAIIGKNLSPVTWRKRFAMLEKKRAEPEDSQEGLDTKELPFEENTQEEAPEEQAKHRSFYEVHPTKTNKAIDIILEVFGNEEMAPADACRKALLDAGIVEAHIYTIRKYLNIHTVYGRDGKRYWSQPDPEIIKQIAEKTFTSNKIDLVLEMKKHEVVQHDERTATNRKIREAARTETLYDLIERTVPHIEEVPPVPPELPGAAKDAAVVCMLSDIHYGIAYDNHAGSFNPIIAKMRVMTYAEKLCLLSNGANTIHVALLGDLVSGRIHNQIRVENVEDAVRQTMNVAELVTSFLLRLANSFNKVYVHSVGGNHSRLPDSMTDAPRGERLDNIIKWYCQGRLADFPNVFFPDTQVDDTIVVFEAANRTFMAVHGDYDKDLSASAVRISSMLNRRIDYVLAGHMHVAKMDYSTIPVFQNGSVSGSGDDYSFRNRLFGPPVQVALRVGKSGVTTVYPVDLRLAA